MANSIQEEEKKEAAISELQIGRMKKEIDDLLIKFYTEDSDDPEDFWSLRISQARLSLKSCSEMIEYIAKTSPPAANELGLRLQSVLTSFRLISQFHDVGLLQDWYKTKLAPLLNRVEQEGFLIASARRQASGDGNPQFAWSVGEPPGGEEHIQRFGKTAEEFRYLDHTCPVCGGRIDEMGWCGCGTIGGG